MAPRWLLAAVQASGVGLVARTVRAVQSRSGSATRGPGDLTLHQVRIHPGIIAAVVVVSMLALLAAAFIIRKYCFPESHITYRYSVLRRRHEEQDNSTTSRPPDDSDEDLLE